MKSSPAPRAFSLIELLVVIAILAILAVLAAPALSSLTRGADIARGGEVLFDQINLARQAASAKGQVMELRFVKLADRTSAGFDALQVWTSGTDGNMKPDRPLVPLPISVTIATNALSPAFASLSNGLSMPSGVGAASGRPYTAFQFRPSGVITPPLPMSNSFFTVVSTPQATTTTLPPNYALVQVNPVTGAPLIYRP